MAAKRGPTSTSVQKRAERERLTGLDPDDEAGRWLAERDPAPPPELSKSATKSKVLHQWRRRQQGKGS
jgi:hypothetical protein